MAKQHYNKSHPQQPVFLDDPAGISISLKKYHINIVQAARIFTKGGGKDLE